MKVFDYDEMTSVMQHLFDKNEVLEELQNEMNNAGIAELASCTKMLGDMIANNEEDIEDIRRVRNNIFDQGGRASYIDFDEINKGHHEKLEEVRFRIKMLRETLKVTDANVPSLLKNAQTFVDISNIDNLRYFIDKGVSTEAVSRLKKLGYKEEELLSIIKELSKEDIKALNLLGEGEYEKVFKIDPDGLTPTMNAFIADYVTKTAIEEMDKAAESTNKEVPELKKIMSALSMADGEYKDSSNYKHLMSISAFLSMDIDSNARNVFEETKYYVETAQTSKYKEDLFSLLSAVQYMNSEYDGMPNRKASVTSDPRSAIKSDTIYKLFGFEFDSLKYENDFIFKAHYESGYINSNDMNQKIDIAKDMKEINEVTLGVSNTADAKAANEYTKVMKEIEKKKEELLEEFLLQGGSIIIGVWNPVLGATIAAAANLAKDSNGKNIANFVYDEGKKIYVNRNKYVGGETGIYSNTMLSSFNLLSKGINYGIDMNALSKKEEETMKKYLSFVYGQSEGSIEIGKEKDVLFENAFLDYETMQVLGEVKKKGLLYIGLSHKDRTRLDILSGIDFDSNELENAIDAILNGNSGENGKGYDFTKIGGEGIYDTNVFIEAIDEINKAITSDDITDRGLFEDILKPKTKAYGG